MNSIVANTIHTCGFEVWHHSRQDSVAVNRISTPPIVGVPALLKWLMEAISCSCRTTCPIFSARRRPIIQRPSRRDRRNAVPAAMKARNVT